MTMIKSLATLAVLMLATGAYAGGSHQGGHHGSAAGKPGKAADVSRTVNVTLFDNYFDPEEITVSRGETVRFVVENKGTLVHEFNIGTAAMHDAHQSEMKMMVEHGVIQGGKLNRDMMNMDMGNGHTMKHDDPNTALLEPGETQELVWTFSGEANLEFACNVPGHYQSGMYGDIRVNLPALSSSQGH